MFFITYLGLEDVGFDTDTQRGFSSIFDVEKLTPQNVQIIAYIGKMTSIYSPSRSGK